MVNIDQQISICSDPGNPASASSEIGEMLSNSMRLAGRKLTVLLSGASQL